MLGEPIQDLVDAPSIPYTEKGTISDGKISKQIEPSSPIIESAVKISYLFQIKIPLSWSKKEKKTGSGRENISRFLDLTSLIW